MRFTAVVALVAAIVGAVVGGAGTAVVTYWSQQSQFRDERDRLVRERKIDVCQQYVADALALIPATNDLADCAAKNKPATGYVGIAAVPACADLAKVYRQADATLVSAELSLKAIGSPQARAAAAKVGAAKGTPPLYSDYDSLKLGAAIFAFVDATHCETVLIAEKGC